MLDAVGWRRPAEPPATVEVPVTPGLVEQLFQRRYELGHGNIDRLTVRDAESDPALRAKIDAAIEADRQATITLDRFIARTTAAF